MKLYSSTSSIGTVPYLVSTTPNSYGNRVSVSSNIVLTYSEVIVAGSGSISILDAAGRIVFQESINSSLIKIVGNTVTFDPAVNLEYGTSYSISILPGFVKSLSGVPSSYQANTNSFYTEFSPVAVSLTGTNGDDTLYGSDLSDVINGGGGADSLFGLGGDDVINGGNENDSGRGDGIHGGSGNDLIHGNDGGDYIEGDEGNDQIFGDAGNDTLIGGDGDDVVDGGIGNDSIEDLSGHNTLRGGDGNDSFVTGTNSYNVIDAGAGNDVFRITANDDAKGGDGNDAFEVSVYPHQSARVSNLDGGAGDDKFHVRFFRDSVQSVLITGGSGIDTYELDTGWSRTTSKLTITDFVGGLGGDLIDLDKVLSNDFTHTGNPFSGVDVNSNLLRLVKDGSDTLLQIRVADGNTTGFYDLVRFLNLAPEKITAANFIGGFDPKGGPVGLTLTGTAGNDSLAGYSLNDTLYGQGGADILYGNAGDDILIGGDESPQDGNDSLDGGEGNDLLQGGAGNDYLSGGKGNDTLEGGSGNDKLDDRDGKNILRGGAGNDELTSYSQDGSVLEGGDGDDKVIGGRGADSISGGAGNDQITIDRNYPSSGSVVTASGDDGDDTFILQFSNLSLGTVKLSGGTGSDSYLFQTPYMGQEIIITDFSSVQGDRIDLHPALPLDTNGNPFGASSFLKIEQVGSDVVLSLDRDGLAGTSDAMHVVLTLQNIHLNDLTTLNFLGGWDPRGGSVGVTLNGTSGDDELVGGALNDVLNGGDGADHLLGGGGNDILDGGDETKLGTGDLLEGGFGDDQLFGRKGNDILKGDQGNDTLDGGEGVDRLDGGAGDDTLDGGAGNDYISDKEGNNTLRGGAGDDYLTSLGTGKNLLDGGEGDDTFDLGSGNDTVIGGDGKDTINIRNGESYSPHTINVDAGSGDDVIGFSFDFTPIKVFASGGAGQDTYRVNARYGNGLLTIADFAAGAGGDVIDLMPMLIYPTVSENPFGKLGIFRLVQQGNDTVLEYDSDGAANASNSFKPIIVLTGVNSATMSAANFSQNMSPNGGPEGRVIEGSEAKDTISGTFLNDTLRGNGGDDYISGGIGDDILEGGAGNDWLGGEEGNDQLDGGTGDDILSERDNAGNNDLKGGVGNDTLDTSGIGRNRLDGGEGNDKLSAGNGNDTLIGGSGNDTFSVWSSSYDSGSANKVIVDGGEGDDYFTIRLAENRATELFATGGPGRDTYRFAATFGIAKVTILDFAMGFGGDVLDLVSFLPSQFSEGNPFGALGLFRTVDRADGVEIQLDSDGASGSKQFEDLVFLKGTNKASLTAENFRGGFSPDGSSHGILVQGSEARDRLQGGYLDDVINGLGGDDEIDGGSGDDKIDGGAGADAITGGKGNDLIIGGDGNDVLSDNSGSNEIYGGAGDDKIYISGDGQNNAEGNEGNDRFELYVSSGKFNGGDGDDSFTVSVLSKKDTSSGEVVLNGGSGNDTFSVFAGVETNQKIVLTGGEGQDKFVLSRSTVDSNLTVLDFQAGPNGDVIDLAQFLNYSNAFQSPITNPFSDGHFNLIQRGNDTVLQFDYDGKLGETAAWTILTLKNLEASKLDASNIVDFIDPHGSVNGITIRGDDAANVLKGGLMDDTLFGYGGDDVFFGGGGYDYLNGGEGIDTANYSRKLSDYVIGKFSGGHSVKDKLGYEATDIVIDIERLHFSDITVNLTTKDKAALLPAAGVKQLIELYIAFFNRIPDGDGMAYWLDQLKAGQSIDQISETFYKIGSSDQFSSRSGFTSTMTNDDFINKFYKNVLGRANGADTDGLNYWRNKLATGESSRGSLAKDILAAAHSFKGDATYGVVADLLENKYLVGLKVAVDWGITFNSNAYEYGVEIAHAVTANDMSAALRLVGISSTDILV